MGILRLSGYKTIICLKGFGQWRIVKMAAFWDVALYSLVDIDKHFKGNYCLHHRVIWTHLP
jgi:hypothetical protein